MVQCTTLCISGTWVSFGTWILATLVDAGSITRALGVYGAFDSDDRLAVTVLERIAHHTDRARADSLVTLSQTLRTSGARVELRARVNAHSVSACFGRSAFDV